MSDSLDDLFASGIVSDNVSEANRKGLLRLARLELKVRYFLIPKSVLFWLSAINFLGGIGVLINEKFQSVSLWLVASLIALASLFLYILLSSRAIEEEKRHLEQSLSDDGLEKLVDKIRFARE